MKFSEHEGFNLEIYTYLHLFNQTLDSLNPVIDISTACNFESSIGSAILIVPIFS